MTTSILFVCTGNICRSPTVEEVFRKKVYKENLEDMLEIDSAGTHGYHVGESPDSRSISMAAKRGYDITSQKAREIRKNDFTDFDIILAMDEDNYKNLMKIAPKGTKDKVRMFLSFSQDIENPNMPDPYYGDGDGFELVLDLAEIGSSDLLHHIRKNFL